MTREFSTGGVVYKIHRKPNTKHKAYLWLVTKSKPNKDYPEEVWRLPKGWLDDLENGMKPGPLSTGSKRASSEQIAKAALKEVQEEGGVKAKIIENIVTDRYFYTNKEKKKVVKFVTYFLMEWEKDLKEGFGEETEEVSWLDYEKAKERLTYPREKKVLEKAKEFLDAGLQANLI